MSSEPFRLPPMLPVTAVKTYSIAAPRATHWRAATCAEVECENHTHGWVSDIDESTEDGQKWAFLIRKRSGRSYTETRLDSGVTRFAFGPGQTCFQASEHKLPNGRPELYVVRGGDWRGNPRGEIQQGLTPGQWTDDFGQHQEVLADRLKRG